MRRRSACGERLEGGGTREGGALRYGGLRGILGNGRVQELVRGAGARFVFLRFWCVPFLVGDILRASSLR